MVLTNIARSRLEDVRDLEATSNGELADRWGMDSGKEVVAYLRDELSEYTYRNLNSATSFGVERIEIIKEEIGPNSSD